jgi:DNA polymerase III delta prime subunit
MFQKSVKLIILDKTDSMTYYENKTIPAIRSKCADFRFNNIDYKHISTKLYNIVENENLNMN